MREHAFRAALGKPASVNVDQKSRIEHGGHRERVEPILHQSTGLEDKGVPKSAMMVGNCDIRRNEDFAKDMAGMWPVAAAKATYGVVISFFQRRTLHRTTLR